MLNTVDVMREVNAGAELKWELAAKMADMRKGAGGKRNVETRQKDRLMNRNGKENSQTHQIELQITVNPEMIPGTTESLLLWKRHHCRLRFNLRKPVKLT